jgi:lipid A 3-O-deacylase
MTQHPNTLKLLAPAAIALALLSPAAHALYLAPSGFYVEAGAGQHDAYSLAIGVTRAWDWQKDLWGGKLSGYWEGYISNWNARNAGGSRENYIQLGIVPNLRFRFDEGRSPWFLDGGIGLSYTDGIFRNETRTFSTRLNFVDNLAVGRNFGVNGKHELSLRFQHVSNADARKPNPGMDFLQVRYAVAF